MSCAVVEEVGEVLKRAFGAGVLGGCEGAEGWEHGVVDHASVEEELSDGFAQSGIGGFCERFGEVWGGELDFAILWGLCRVGGVLWDGRGRVFEFVNMNKNFSLIIVHE